MDFWSKGLGERTIALSLAQAESLKSEGTLCLRGRMKEPVSWEYIMRLAEDDLVDFFALLKEPALADYLYRSPKRWQLYAGLIRGGLQLALLVLVAVLRRTFAREIEEEEVEEIYRLKDIVRRMELMEQTLQRIEERLNEGRGNSGGSISSQ